MEKKVGIESKFDDKVVINWTTKTVITDLGEFGTYVCSFNTHGAIQRYYVDDYEGKGHTASEVAQKFDFAHAKAVYIYAKLHGFTKASLGQTDIEFESGLTVDEAVEENIQALKRKAIRKTELKKWKEIQKDADSWNDFQHSVYFPMKDWVEANLPKYRPPKYCPKRSHNSFCAVVGISDWHYLKYAFDYKGRATYNRKIAIQKLKETNNELISKMWKFGKPEMFFIPSGSDDLHIDNLIKTTTSGTSQVRETSGDWELNMKVFLDTIIAMHELYAQIAPVVIVPMHGNHNNQTSIMMHQFLRIYFGGRKDVTVLENYAPRVYQNYGKNAFVFQHGKKPALNKFQREVHRYFLAEAKEQKVNLNYTEHLTAFTGDLHHDAFKDLGGVKHFIIPSPTPPDVWHKDEGFVGSRQESSLYIFDKQKGRQVILYT